MYGCIFGMCHRVHPVTGLPCGANVNVNGKTPRWVRGKKIWRSFAQAEIDVQKFEELIRTVGFDAAWERLRGNSKL